MAQPVLLTPIVVYDLEYALWRAVENSCQVGYAFTIGTLSANDFIAILRHLWGNSAEFKQPVSDAM
jgi:hypothetical protein